MKTDLELKIQSYLDGEIDPADAREVEKALAADHEATALLNELRMTRQILKGNEPEVRLQENRDFYFSQIKRRIESAETQASRVASRPGWSLRRLIAPLVTGAACIFALVLGIGKYNTQPNGNPLPCLFVPPPKTCL
jgi:anti-sigma factor RsiW